MIKAEWTNADALDLQPTCNQLATDCISRQAAIEWLRNEWDGMVTSVFKGIENLPSAEPEIIRCKDCKHHRTYQCMDSMPLEVCGMGQTLYDANVDYCSLAERREDE